jgi:hypothetical protein
VRTIEGAERLRRRRLLVVSTMLGLTLVAGVAYAATHTILARPAKTVAKDGGQGTGTVSTTPTPQPSPTGTGAGNGAGTGNGTGSGIGKGGGNGNGNDNGSGKPSAAPHAFTMSGVVTGTLAPGNPLTLRVTIANPNSQDIQVLEARANIGTPSRTGCLPSWVAVAPYLYAGGPQVIVPGRGSRTLDLPIQMTNLPTTNQDACKGATFPIALTGSARQVGAP